MRLRSALEVARFFPPRHRFRPPGHVAPLSRRAFRLLPHATVLVALAAGPAAARPPASGATPPRARKGATVSEPTVSREPQSAALEWYERARTLAREGRIRESLDALDRAFDAGYPENETPRLDPDLEALRAHPRFRDILDGHTTLPATSLVSHREPGEPLVVRGEVRDPGGRPIPGATVFVHHADAQGLYSGDRKSDPNPRLFGSMRTGADGRFEFRTIRPGSHPDTSMPQHIHFRVRAPGFRRARFELLFADDPLLKVGRGRKPDLVVTPSPPDSAGVRTVECPVTLDPVAH